MERWNTLKVVLFQQLFGQLYCTRMVHLVTTVLLSLSGRRYRECERKVRQAENADNENENRMNRGILAMLEEENQEMVYSEGEEQLEEAKNEEHTSSSE